MSNSFKNVIIYSISLYIILFYTFCVSTINAYGQDLDSLFKSDELIYIELRADYNSILEDSWKEDVPEGEPRGGEPVYHDAVIVYGPEGNKIELPVRVKARGNFRRDPAHCKFPPLMFNFKKKEAKNTLFDDQDKPKLVTTCQYEPEVVKEYLIYKMYNLITDFSFNVKLANILYFNTAKNKKLNERIGFFIEEDKKVAKRNDAKIVKKHHYPFDLNPDYEAKLSMFQFMIGNTDWYYTTGQNLDVMYPNDTTLAPIPVPYDFDFSEFVNAAYSKPAGVPDEMLAKKQIFKGMCLSNEKLIEVIEYFNMLKPRFESLISNNEHLKNFNKKECLDYLDNFYTIINTQEMLKTEILDTCYTRKDYLPFE
jgi:hypothetical protein